LLEWESPVVTVQPLQTELVKPVSRLTISETLAGRLLAAAELVQRVARPQTDPELAEFRERFAARYDRRLVPIAEALDIDSGVGFGGGESHVSEALTEGLPFGPAREQEPLTDSIDRVRIRLFERALSQRSAVVELDEDLLDMLPQSELREPTCESFALVVRLARAHDGRTLVVVPELASPSALPLFGRFCEADAELHQAASAYAELEQRLAGETVLADVVYLPSDEAANVVKRPLLRKYEIPCGGRSGTAPDRQLPISDLLVGVEGQHVELYSRRLKSRVAVRFATAHNYDQTTLPTLYRFLGALQHQDGCRLSSGWTWGALEGSAFLPRVVCGDTILCLARWEISAREWAPLLAAEPENLLDRARELRVARGLPRWLTRSEFDRRLTVDFENQLSLEELVHDARKQPRIALEELVPTSEQLVLHGPEGSYAAQFVVPFVRRAPLARRPVPSELLGSSVRPTRRCRIPGSDWLYARIYAGKSQHAALLRCLQDGVVEPSLGSDATLWFYLPFADPESHLRVRFQGEPARLTSSVLSRLERALEPLLESGAVSRLELGSYEPELERYGGPTGVQLAERVFFADSDASSQLVALAADDHDLRWRLALVGIDRLLSDCGAGLEQRAGLARRASAAYGDEMGATTATWKVVGERYRNCAPVLSRWLWDSPGTDVILKKTRRILAARSARIESIWKEIERATLDGSMRLPDDEELPLTLAHLHALRVLGAGSRAREMVLYEFLKRQYAAQRSTGGAKYELRSD
jgi:thiopeptide-type bacteriocin biosynthesis protein